MKMVRIFIGLEKNYMVIVLQLVNLKRQLRNKSMRCCQMTSPEAAVPSVPVGMYFTDFPSFAWPFSPSALEKVVGTEVFILGFNTLNIKKDFLLPFPLHFP